MSTARLQLVSPDSDRPTPAPAIAWELSGVSASPLRIRLDLRRTPEGELEVVGRSEPAGSHAEVEVCAGFERRVGSVDEDGRFRVRGLPSGTSHVKVTLRGGAASPVVLPGVKLA